MPRKSVQHGTAASPVVRAHMHSTCIGAAAVARGCVAIITVAVKVSNDVVSESMEVTHRVIKVTHRFDWWGRWLIVLTGGGVTRPRAPLVQQVQA